VLSKRSSLVLAAKQMVYTNVSASIERLTKSEDRRRSYSNIPCYTGCFVLYCFVDI